MTALRRLTGAGLRGVQTTLRPAWRRSVVVRGVDRTAAHEDRSALVLAPHPDDETLGCGALIARKCAAHVPVRILVAADGRSSHPPSLIDPEALVALRREESVRAAAALGVDEADVLHLGIADGELDARSPALTGALVALIDHDRPDDVFVTSRHDWHPDHAALNAAARVAVRASSHPTRLLEYPVWWWVEGPWLRHARRHPREVALDVASEVAKGFFGPRAELVAAPPFLGAKRDALAEYRSQVQHLGDDPRWQVFDRRFTAALLGGVEVYFPQDLGGAPPGQRQIRGVRCSPWSSGRAR